MPKEKIIKPYKCTSYGTFSIEQAEVSETYPKRDKPYHVFFHNSWECRKLCSDSFKTLKEAKAYGNKLKEVI
jgi:hypothetical protein